MDYPRDCLTVQVLDDSTDETADIVAGLVARLRDSGLNIHHVRRENRQGYKAGALAYGLTLLDGVEYVAVLDADFVPAPDFLTRTIPHLVHNSRLGVVQGRWGHLNAFSNPLTFGQMLALDGHFVVEQTGRNRSGWLMNFNGSGGVWRVTAIEDAGGWNDATLTEDLDLSYRAQLKGWGFLYLPDVVVPGELPPELSAYKQQQSRWAKGGTQCLTLLLRPVWGTRGLTLMQRLMATMHLGQYLTAPLVVLILLLTPVMMLWPEFDTLPLSPLGLAGLGPPLVFVISQRALYTDWKRRLLGFPALIALGTGMAWNNSIAVLGGLLHKRGGEFRRTPKYAAARTGNQYRLRVNRAVWVELSLALYSLWGAWLAARHFPTLVPYLTLYGFAFGVVALWGLRDYFAARWLRLAQAG
jgi:cellulose synthase/poly-beta-1,6-N-acetylglucosamine synthase-like glycosyltransferase